MTTHIIGIDEAGRGPALGDMVLTGVKVSTKDLTALRNLGVQDSKTFGSSVSAKKRRCAIAQKIIRLVKVKSIAVSVNEIDNTNINVLEIRTARKIINHLGSEDSEIFLDGCTLFKTLETEFPSLHALDKADSLIDAVAAASIVAKHIRDCIWRKIMRQYQAEFGEIKGNGYGQYATQFIECYYNKYGCLPKEARKSWKNVKRIVR